MVPISMLLFKKCYYFLESTIILSSKENVFMAVTPLCRHHKTVELFDQKLEPVEKLFAFYQNDRA